MARLDPVYIGCKPRNEISSSAGDVRSTFDNDLLEKSAAVVLKMKNI